MVNFDWKSMRRIWSSLREIDPWILFLAFILLFYSGGKFFLQGIYEPIISGSHDFGSYYTAAMALRRGVDIYDGFALAKSLGMKSAPPLLYPPMMAILSLPFSFISFRLASAMFLFTNYVLLAASVWLICKSIGILETQVNSRDSIRGFTNVVRVAVILFMVLNYSPLFLSLRLGQINVVILFLLAATLYLCKKGRFGLAGIPLGIAASIKIIPGLLLPFFLLHKKWRTVTSTFLMIITLFAVSLLFVKVETYEKFVSVILLTRAKPEPYPVNQGVSGFFARLFVANDYTHVLLRSSAITLIGPMALAIVFLVGAFLVTRKIGDPREIGTVFDLQFSLWLVTAMLVSTLNWEHYFVWLYLPFLSLYRYVETSKYVSWTTGMVALAWVTIALTYNYGDEKLGHGGLILLMSPKLYALIALYVILVVTLRAVRVSSFGSREQDRS